MKVLITGGAGFIGSHLADMYISKGCNVVVIDNLCMGSKNNVNPKAIFYKQDITSSGLDAVFKKERPDIVSHHAALIDARQSRIDPMAYTKANISGTVNVLNNCKKYGVKRVLFASSGLVYGDCGLPAVETDALRPSCPYSCTKQAGEAFTQTSGMEYMILRYGNVYGERQDGTRDTGLIAIALQCRKEKKPITVFGDGNTRRDYVHVSDVVEANWLATISSSPVGILNVSSKKTTSTKQIISSLKVLPYYDITKTDVIKNICLDNSLSQGLLGWKPKINLDSYLLTLA